MRRSELLYFVRRQIAIFGYWDNAANDADYGSKETT